MTKETVKIGDRVLILFDSGNPWKDGKLDAISDCGNYARVQCGFGCSSWEHRSHLVRLGQQRMETAIASLNSRPMADPPGWLPFVAMLGSFLCGAILGALPFLLRSIP